MDPTPRSELPPRSVEYTETLTVSEPQTIAKAVIAGCTALGSSLATALADGSVTVWEIVLGMLGTAVAAASVWSVSNKKS